MRKPILYFTIIGLFAGINIFVLNTASQGIRSEDFRQTAKPFTIGQILRAIASVNQATGRQKKVLSDKILSDVRQRKVNFPLTKENEKLLRDEGADNELIEVIRRNSPPLPTPVPTQIPTPIRTPVQTPIPTPITTPKPTSADASFHIEKAKEYVEQKNYDEAIASYTRAIEIDPNNANTFFKRGYIFLMNKSSQREKSISDFTNAIRLKPNAQEDYYFYRALSYFYVIQDYDKAIADYDKSIIMFPTNYAAYKGRGECYENKGNYNLAIADYKKALELSPNYQSAKDGLDRVLKKRQ